MQLRYLWIAIVIFAFVLMVFVSISSYQTTDNNSHDRCETTTTTTNWNQHCLAWKLSNFTEMPKVYVYNIPETWNVRPWRCAVDRLAWVGNFSVDGIGVPENADLKFLYSTNIYALDIIFHQRLLHYPHRTDNPNEADIFFIPYYAGLHYYCVGELYVFNTTEIGNHALAFWEFTKELTFLQNRTLAPKHFMILSRIERDFWELMLHYRTSEGSHWMQFVTLERLALLPEKNNILGVPYPAHIHMNRSDSPDFVPVNYTAKDLLITSNWNSRFVLRKELRRQCDAQPTYCIHYEDPPNWNNTHIALLNRRAIFCMNPPGDSHGRGSFYDSLLMGCIPVVFRPNVSYAFGDVIDLYGEVMIYIDENRIVNGTKSEDVVDLLKSVPLSEIQRRQKFIERYRPIMQYSLLNDDCDAFGLTMRELHRRSKTPRFS